MLRFLNFKNICKMFGYTKSMENGGEELFKAELMRLLILGGFLSHLTFVYSLPAGMFCAFLLQNKSKVLRSAQTPLEGSVR